MIEARRGQLSAASAKAVSARINLGDTSLNAPMPGVIVEKSVEPGSLVAAGTKAFTLDDARVVKVNFGVPDGMLAHLKLGAPAPVQLDALQGRNFTGRITGISASANREARVQHRGYSAEPRSIAQGGHDRPDPYRASEYANCACSTTDCLDDRGIRFE